MQCPHGGNIISVANANTSVLVGGQALLVQPDRFVVSGCRNVPPCVTVNWLTGTTRVSVNSQPILFAASQGQCIDSKGAPAGPPVILTPQTRVQGI
jgi:hypothetical protein